MASFRMSGKPTLYGLLALSAMELVASQKPGSPLAVLQQPTKGFDASTVAASSRQIATPQPTNPGQVAAAPIAERTPSFTEPPSSPNASPHNAGTQAIPPARNASFKDLQSHWSQPFVELLAARGIISGYSDGTFQPDRDIQAAHFGMMLHQAKLYRLKVLQRDQGLVASSTVPISPPPLDSNLKASIIAPTTETEAATLLRTHEIRTRAQAAVFIYRDLQAPLVSQIPAQISTEPQVIPVSSTSWHPAEPTFSESEIDEQQESPRLSATFQWSVDSDWVAQG